MAEKRKEESEKDEYAEIYGEDTNEPPVKKNSFVNYGFGHAGQKRPGCCTACGGPYPMCKAGCSIFDDE